MLSDTAWLAQPHQVYRIGIRSLPTGVERLATIQRGETLFVWIRFWEAAPSGVRWVWGRETLITVVQIPSLLPDSLMPLADYTLPAVRHTELQAEASPAIGLLIALLIGGLVVLSLYPLYKPGLQRLWRTAYLYFRWMWWLWRWRKPHPGQFSEFTASVKSLLRPHAAVHPGSLTLSELEKMQMDSILHQALLALWAMDYRVHFGGESVSPEAIVALWRAVWQAIRRTRPRHGVLLLSPAPVHHAPV